MNTKEKSKSPMVDQLNEAYSVLEMATNALFDLNTLFDVIRENSDEHTNNHRLAGIGSYLACTLGNDVDLVRKDVYLAREDVDNFLKGGGK